MLALKSRLSGLAEAETVIDIPNPTPGSLSQKYSAATIVCRILTIVIAVAEHPLAPVTVTIYAPALFNATFDTPGFC